MPIQRLELCMEHLDPAQREALLETVWNLLRISPGMVTADGQVELALVQCADVSPEDAPLVRLGGNLYPRMTPERLGTLLGRWAR